MDKTTAARIAGTLSNPGKMPGAGTSLPAIRCQRGAILAKVTGSICSSCYALKGNYILPKVQAALERRYQGLTHPRWSEAMATLIQGEKWFRWLDSGDIQSTDHLLRIFEVCRQTPDTHHWLPTREAEYVRAALTTGRKPRNLTIRLSATMIDQPPPAAPKGIRTSTVHTGDSPFGRVCPAPKQGGKCDQCRACWNSRIQNISYKKH